MRVCSLLPSATEIVGALGLTGSLVGRSQECDWPPEVREVPVVTASRVDSERLPSLAIDQAVREALSDGLPLYAVDAELIDRLRPDVIVTQDLCRVCAVSSGDLRSLTAVEAEVISLEANTIAEIEQSVLVLAERLGVPERGREVVARME
ncbi:MAG: cobalamin-binding protein, partial [Chloroflexota bacterium]